jgi:hypothetical protein
LTSPEHVIRVLEWSACVDCASARAPEAPLRKLGEPRVVRGPAGWNVTVRFGTRRAGTATIRLLQNEETLTTYTFRPRAGLIDVGPFVISAPGRYELTLRLTDKSGRTRRLSWEIVAT